MSIIVTGGAGFIGSHFIHDWFKESNETVINLDKLGFGSNLNNLKTFTNDSRHVFIKGNILDENLVSSLFNKYMPRAIIHFAAESHVDRSIENPTDFITNNVIGTHTLLSVALRYTRNLSPSAATQFRFINISTDEVYGTLDIKDPPFTEVHPYQPNSPYSASKAGADHLVRAYYHTYGLPVITTHCSNNYGPHQFHEKLIPHIIQQALAGKPLPIYGDGKNIRDWLYVKDHCSALRKVLSLGRLGETYNIGGNSELTNIEVLQSIVKHLDSFQPKFNGQSYMEQMIFVKDRQGHDKRYAINTEKIEQELNWRATRSFESGLEDTVKWYLHRSKEIINE